MRVQLGFLALASFSLVACGGAGEEPENEEQTLVEWLLENKSFSPVHGLLGIPTNCIALAEDGATCTDLSSYEFSEAADGSFVWTEYEYVYKIEDAPEEIPEYFVDNGLAGGIVFTGTVSAVPGVPLTDAFQLDYEISDAIGPDPYFAELIGGTGSQIFARGSGEGSLLTWSKGEDFLFPGFAIEVGGAGAFFMKTCTSKVEGSGTPGFCAPECRMEEAANGLPLCEACSDGGDCADDPFMGERPAAAELNAAP